jgi:Na+-transporting NADH:ubiquinone oxidoreductase subunit B
MRIIQNFFDSQRKHFVKGGKWEKYYPIFEATETFFFFPDHVTRTGPHIRDSLDLKRFMSLVILALMPPLFFGIYNAGCQSNLVSGMSPDFFPAFTRGLSIVMPLIIVSYTVGFFWEFLFAVVRKHSISEGFLVTGLLFPLTLPPTLPLWQAAVGISFGVVIGKEIFGGTGRNFLNPALTGRAFIFFAYPGKMSGDTVWTVMASVKAGAADAFSGATPLAVAAVTDAYGSTEAALTKAGFTFSTLFWGRHPGSIGETSAFLCLIGAILLMLLGIASCRIIIGGVLGVLSAGFLLNLAATENSLPFLSLNPAYHLVMGGFAFGITYMATDPVSAPGMNTAKWVYGFLIGSLTVFIRVLNPAYPEGVMLSILFMNVFAPLLDHIEIKAKLRKRIANV